MGICDRFLFSHASFLVGFLSCLFVFVSLRFSFLMFFFLLYAVFVVAFCFFSVLLTCWFFFLFMFVCVCSCVCFVCERLWGLTAGYGVAQTERLSCLVLSPHVALSRSCLFSALMVV